MLLWGIFLTQEWDEVWMEKASQRPSKLYIVGLKKQENLSKFY